MDHLNPKERQELAAKAGLHPQYLYQCLTHRRDMDAKKAVTIERASDRRVCRWHVRTDWHEVWPELIGTEGAPAVPGDAAPAAVGVCDAA